MSLIRLTVNEEMISKSSESSSILGIPKLQQHFSIMNGFIIEIILSSLLVFVVLKYGDIKRKDRGFYWVEVYACTRGLLTFLGIKNK